MEIRPSLTFSLIFSNHPRPRSEYLHNTGRLYLRYGYLSHEKARYIFIALRSKVFVIHCFVKIFKEPSLLTLEKNVNRVVDK